MGAHRNDKITEPVVVREREEGSVTVVQLNGRLTVGEGSDTLNTRLEQLLNAGRIRLVLDCSKATAIDSQGISALVRGLISARKRGGNLKLLKPVKRVREVLTITRLLEVIESFDDEQAAIHSFS